MKQLRQLTASALVGVAILASGLMPVSTAIADEDTLTIAYNVNLPSWDPTVGLSAVNPTIQSIYKSVL